MRKTLVAALAVLGLAGLVACSSSSPGKAPASRAASTTTTASNKAAAEAETKRVIGLLALPPGSTTFTGTTLADLVGAATGTEGGGHLLDATGFWHVPLPVDGLDDALLPTGDPSGGLVCQYSGANPTMDQSTTHRSLTAEQAVALVEQVRKLPIGSDGTGPHGCPMDDGQNTVVVLAFPQGDVDLWWHVSGCHFVDNGHITSLTGSLTLP